MEQSSSLWSMIQDGGLVMWLLLGASVTAAALATERALAVRRSRTDRSLIRQIARLLHRDGDADGSLAACREAGGAVGRVLLAGLLRFGGTRQRQEEALEVAALHEVGRLRRGMGVLASIAHLAPLLGFLGTVTGMMLSFEALGRFGTSHPELVALGIQEALTTTAAGLAVAIPTQLTHNVLAGRIDDRIREIEIAAHSLLELTEPLGGPESGVPLR